MKNLFYLLFFISIKSFAQDISGIYRGTLTNDSLKMIQNYELALSEYRGKITGYSYITFVYHDTLYYGIKRIKATKENGELIVEDVQMLSNNYPVRPNKGVHVINRIPLSQNGAIEDLNGKWETTESKKHRYYSIGGDMSLKKENDSTRSALLSHLKELDIINYQDEKKESKKDIAKNEVKQKPKEIKPDSKEVAFKESKPKEMLKNETVVKQTAAADIKKKEDGPQKKSNENKAPVTASQTTAVETPPKEIVAKPAQKQAIATETKSSEKKPDNTIAGTAKVETKPVTTETNSPQESIQEKTTTDATTKSAPEKTTAVPTATVSSPIVKRVTNTIQTVTVSADSLILSFYDNGVVDGDSISVYLNNENIIEKVKLKEAAVKKTIYINGSTDEIKLTLVAENLGSIPPNTGLLIIQDGMDRYQIRFSADMQTNASVIIRKKKR